MSGANTIAVATVLVETGMVPMREPTTTMTLDAPAGLVGVTAECKGGKARSVEFRNVPAFVWALGLEVDVPGLETRVKVDIAYGGTWYALVDAASVGLEIESGCGARLVDVGERIKRAVQAKTDPEHPENPEIRGVTVLEFTSPLRQEEEEEEKKGGGSSRLVASNTVVVSPGRLDRSPCGTRTCARLAVLHARGQLAVGASFQHRSVTGAEFVGTVCAKARVGEYSGIVPAVRGTAWIAACKQVVLHPEDPFPEGLRVGNKWHVI